MKKANRQYGKNFNPRTPCGVRQRLGIHFKFEFTFQSTHPVWGATIASIKEPARETTFQSTHPVWGATVTPAAIGDFFNVFQSTHPVWGATIPCHSFADSAIFQSTHPVWGATAYHIIAKT